MSACMTSRTTMKLVTVVIMAISAMKVVSALNYDMLYWEVPPLIFTRNGKVSGIYKDSWDMVDRRCGHKDSLRPKVRLSSYKKFGEYLKNPNIGEDYTMDPALRNASGVLASWFPVLTPDYRASLGVRNKRLHYFTMFYIPGLAVFAKREEITLTYKIYLSLKATWQILILLLLTMAVFVAMLVWLSENRKNEEVNKEFGHGSLKCLWLGFVTMSSVGYGDIASKSFVGRLVMVIWMMFGLIFASALTALASEDYYQTRHLDINNKTVGTLRRSYEAKAIKDYWQCEIKEYDTYEEILQGLRDGETNLSIINKWVAAYMQENMNDNKNQTPLAVVNSINDINIPVSAYVHYLNLSEFPSEEIQKCAVMSSTFPNALKNSIAKNVKKLGVDTIYIPPLSELFGEFNPITYALIFIASLIVLGFVFDSFYLSRLAKKNPDETVTVAAMDNSASTAEESNAVEFHTLPECAEEFLRLGRELATIKDTLAEIAENVKNDTIRPPGTHNKTRNVNSNNNNNNNINNNNNNNINNNNSNTVLQLDEPIYTDMIY